MIRFLTFLLFSLTVLSHGEERPNIILIMADDLGIEGLSCYGSDSYQTPNLDKLAAQGMRFTHAFSQPLCTPTRVQIMTGKYNHRNWLYFGCLDPREKTFGHIFQEAGYKTCISGKWQLTSYDPPEYPGSEQRRNTGMHPSKAGFDRWSLFHSEHTEDKGSRYANPTVLENTGMRANTEGKYGEDIAVDVITDFLKENREDPFFLYYPMALPHWPFNPTPDSEDWTDPAKRLDEELKYFPDMVHYMDKVIGQILKSVDDLGLAENTMVIFFSDNGTDGKITSKMNGEDYLGGKNRTTQNGIHVPLIVRWPGKIAAKSICEDIIDCSDFIPTMCEIAKIETKPEWKLDGRSFAPQLLGAEKTNPRDSAFFWYDPTPGWDKDKFSRHIFAIDKQFKLYSDGRFYDYLADPFEKKSLPFHALDERGIAAFSMLRSTIEEMMVPR